jgi:acetyl-CoA C-acetyltransferase
VQAVVSGVQALLAGDAETALVGGAECMSRSPHTLPVARFG